MKTIKIGASLLLFLIIRSYYSIGQTHHFILKVHFNDSSVKALGIGEAYYYKFKGYYSGVFEEETSSIIDSLLKK